ARVPIPDRHRPRLRPRAARSHRGPRAAGPRPAPGSRSPAHRGSYLVMPDIAIGLLGVGLLFLLVLLKTYLGVALLVACFVGLALLRGLDTATALLADVSFSGTAVFAFTILPMF